MSAEIILFTSLKGGCGKSTACASIAAAAARQNKRVLCVSLDVYSASMDIFFGMDSSFVLDASDYPQYPLSDICLKIPGADGLSLCVRLPFSDAANSFSEIDFLKATSSCGLFDLIFVDKGEGCAENIAELSDLADKTVVVSTQMNDSVRCAEMLACIIHENCLNDSNVSLLLNSFYTDPRSAELFPGIGDIMERTKLPLLGILPFSDSFYVNQSYPTYVKDPLLRKAADNVCCRLLGKDIKLLDFLPIKNRRKLLNN